MERRVAYAAALVMFFAMMFWTCASCLESTLTEAMCTLPGTRGADGSSCMDTPGKFGLSGMYMEQIIKQSLVLEDELNDPVRPCQFCGGFFDNIVSLAERGEAACASSGRDAFAKIKLAYSDGRSAWERGGDPIAVSDGLRRARAAATEAYYADR